MVSEQKMNFENGARMKELWMRKHRHQFEGPRKIESGNLSRVIKDLLVQKLESKVPHSVPVPYAIENKIKNLRWLEEEEVSRFPAGKADEPRLWSTMGQALETRQQESTSKRREVPFVGQKNEIVKRT